MESVMWFTIEAVFAGVNVALIYFFMDAFLKREKKTSAAVKIAAVLSMFALKFFTAYSFMEIAIIHSLVTATTAFVIGIASFKGKIFGILAASFFTLGVGGVLEILAGTLISIFQNVPLENMQLLSIYRIQGRIFTSLLMILAIILVRLYRSSPNRSISLSLTLSLCVLPTFSIFLVHQFILHNVHNEAAPSTNEAITLMSILLINIFVLVMFESTNRKNMQIKELALIEVQNEAYQNHIKQLMDYQLQIRIMSHDFNQQVQELYTLCSEKHYVDLLSRLSELSNRHTKNLLVDTGNLMLDSIMTSKIEAAERNEIDFVRKLDVIPDLEYMDAKICVLLGNALDNAIEACTRTEGSKLIGLELIATQNQLLCHIVNSVGVQPRKVRGFIQTFKGDALRHGIGLRSMQKTCDELGGNMSYEFDDKYFKLWIKLSF